MELFEAIRLRHSYRGAFEPRPVPREDLQRIVQAGVQAPSGCNAQSTTFVMVDDKDLLAQLAKVMSKPVFETAPALIACITDPAPVYQDMSFHVEDCAAAVENILLAITAMGYATVWIDGYLRTENRAVRIGEMLGVPQGKTVRVLLPLGVPTQTCSQKEKKPLGDRAWFNRYGDVQP